MNDSQGYQKFTDVIMSMIKFLFKIITSNIYAAVLNLPLLLTILFIPIKNDVVSWVVLCIVSVNIIPTYIILVRHFKDDLNIISTAKIVYQEQGKQLLFASVISLVLGFIVYVDILFFKNIDMRLVEIIFSGILLALVVFTLNFIQVASTFKASFKALLLVTVAYTKELTLSATTTLMWVFISIMLSLFVLPILSILIIGTTIAIHNWFSSKSIDMMLNRISREDIKEY